MRTSVLRTYRISKLVLLLAMSVAVSTGCVKELPQNNGAGNANGSKAASMTKIIVDGSSTVEPITKRMAEAYMDQHENVDIKVQISGTSGGMAKFVNNEIDICDASRPIKESEMALCKENKIDYLELTVAIDGLSVVVNKDNDWCDCLTVEQLKSIFIDGSEITKWNQIDPSWPDQQIKLFGPDDQSGTFDYFIEAVLGKKNKLRIDNYTSNTSDKFLVTGIAGEKYALGFFGYAHYADNKDKLTVVGVDGGEGCVKPEKETIESGKYSPLSRPLFLYVNKAKLAQPEIKKFLEYYLGEGQPNVAAAAYVPLNQETLVEQQAKLKEQ